MRELPEDIEWRDVPGYKGAYQVSSGGEVRSIARSYTDKRGIASRKPGVTLRKDTNSVGYSRVTLSAEGVATRVFVHRLVCEAFNGPMPKPDMVAAHYDGDRSNNSASNLRWATHSENCLDKVRHGTHARGERNPSAILSRGDARMLRSLYQSGAWAIGELADIFKVSKTTVADIGKGRTWRHIND